MADSLVVKNWHFASINFAENVVVSSQKSVPESTTGQVTGVATKRITCDVVLEAELVPPLDPGDSWIPGTSTPNPARKPSPLKTASPPEHGCYVDLDGVLHATNLGATESYFLAAPSTAGGWGAWRQVGQLETEYADQVIPVITWRVRFRSIRSQTRKMTWTGSMDLDKFDA